MTEENIIDGGHELVIAKGRSRRETEWKNGKVKWQELVNRLTNTTRTYETVQEYKKMPKDDQDRIKDVGGFVGGKLKQGVRKASSVEYRTVVTLDADFAPSDIVDTLELVIDYAAVIYSTHKHTPEKPRIRIVIPLKRQVSVEEYEAVARKLAEEIGMDYFDDTTYEPSRLMYWPSTSKDGQFLAQVFPYAILDPDKVLAKYIDWKDTSCWPTSSRAEKSINREAERQCDPTSKSGAIGAFCRTYDIHAAIAKFIPDAYTECSTPNRYTYTGGSTSGGLVVYGGGVFAYSNHATDPASGMLCNAFDLVRVHLFGLRDDEAKPNTPTNKMPSYQAMLDFIAKDEETKKTIGREALTNAQQEFDGEPLPQDITEEDLEWVKDLEVSKNGSYEATIGNILLILRKDKNLRGIKGLDCFKDRYIVEGQLPWPRARAEEWSDLDDAGLRYYIEKVYGIEARQKIIDALSIVFEERAFHPVKQFIESREWDGIPRVDTLLIDYLGAEDCAYTREITRKTLVAAVARIYNPGVKFDQMLVLVGKQGIGKSLIIHRLANGWCNDTITDIKGKESYEALKGSWLIEMGELVALKKAEREAMKNYISKTEDTYRKAYGRNITTDRRQCVFIGTTNEPTFLDDSTGNRRYWVVDTNEQRRTKVVWCDLPAGGEEVRQIWAEAFQMFKQGEDIMNLSEEAKQRAELEQEGHSEENTIIGVIEKYLDTPTPLNWHTKSIYERVQYYNGLDAAEGAEPPKGDPRECVCVYEVWCECVKRDDRALPTKADARFIGQCLTKLGWSKDNALKRYGPYGVQRGYRKV